MGPCPSSVAMRTPLWEKLLHTSGNAVGHGVPRSHTPRAICPGRRGRTSCVARRPATDGPPGPGPVPRLASPALPPHGPSSRAEGVREGPPRCRRRAVPGREGARGARRRAALSPAWGRAAPARVPWSDRGRTARPGERRKDGSDPSGPVGPEGVADHPRLHELRRARHGQPPWCLGLDDGRPLLRRAIEAGITTFDTANVYSLGSSEEITGKLLGEFARRDEVVIATKVHGRMFPGPKGGGPAPRRDPGRGRRQPAAARHRLHRPVPDPPLGPGDADRGDDGGARRPRAVRARRATSGPRRCGHGDSCRRSTSRTCTA